METEHETTTALHRTKGGRWLVTTQGSTHLWDLDAWTYTRLPGPESGSGGMEFDGVAHRITKITRWPRIGERSWVWFDDPQDSRMEQYRVSSKIERIEKIK